MTRTQTRIAKYLALAATWLALTVAGILFSPALAIPAGNTSLSQDANTLGRFIGYYAMPPLGFVLLAALGLWLWNAAERKGHLATYRLLASGVLITAVLLLLFLIADWKG